MPMRYKILLIEDNSLDINLFDQMLCQTGLKTNSLQVARSLQTGLEMAAVGKPDIIFLDLNLADSTGLDTFRAIRTVCENVPVVILTGLEDERLALEALHEGAQDYLIKKNLTPDLIARSLTYSVERKKAENEILITKLRQEALIENTKDGIWAVDLDLELLSVNHAFTEAMRSLCGRKPTVGDLVTDFIPADYLDFHSALDQVEAIGVQEVHAAGEDAVNDSVFDCVHVYLHIHYGSTSMATRRNFFKYLGLAGGVAAGGAVAAASVLPNTESKEVVDEIAKNKGTSLSFHTTYGEELKEPMRLDSSGALYLGTSAPSQKLYVYEPKYVPGTRKDVIVGLKPGPDGELYLKVNGKWRKIVTE